MVLAAGALNVLGRLLEHPKLNIVKEAAWTVSNITAGSSEQIQKVIDAGIIQPLLHVLQTVCHLQECSSSMFHCFCVFREISSHRRKQLGLLQITPVAVLFLSCANLLKWVP